MGCRRVRQGTSRLHVRIVVAGEVIDSLQQNRTELNNDLEQMNAHNSAFAQYPLLKEEKNW